MKYFFRHFLVCWVALSLAATALAGGAETNSSAPAENIAATATNSAPLAATNSAPTEAATNSPSPATTNSAPSAMTNAAPVTAATNSPAASTNDMPSPEAELDIKMALARQEHRDKSYAASAQILEDIIKTNSPPAMQRAALFELALVLQDDEQAVKAQQVWSQFLHVYPDDPQLPEVLLRQGLLYRKMGVDGLAIGKFYAVMSSAVKLEGDNMEHYKKLVIQAQTEIADTFFMDAKFEEAADYYNRILKSGDAEPDRIPLEAKLIRSISYLTNHVETIGRAQSFLARFPKSPDVPEVRFLLAAALKHMERNQDSMQQVLLLLQSQQANVSKDPDAWAYWQRRAGNEIANQLYKEGDYNNALQIYLSLADLDKSPGWQVPVWYQIGLVYEQLQQWQKATDTYTRILDRKKELNETNSTPALSSMLEMAKWRQDYIAWTQKAKANEVAWRPTETTNAPPR